MALRRSSSQPSSGGPTRIVQYRMRSDGRFHALSRLVRPELRGVGLLEWHAAVQRGGTAWHEAATQRSFDEEFLTCSPQGGAWAMSRATSASAIRRCTTG